MALPETPVASTWDLPSQTPEPAAPATGTFKQQLLSNAEKRREQKQKGAAAESSPLLLSPSPTFVPSPSGRPRNPAIVIEMLQEDDLKGVSARVGNGSLYEADTSRVLGGCGCKALASL